jgi:hypothetical protein
MTVHDETYYDQPNAPQPRDNELCTNTRGDAIFWKVGQNGEKTKVNATAELRSLIAVLEQSGVFINAEAFINNRKIYRFFFDQNRAVAWLDPELRLNPLYRYYAIREIQNGPQGEYQYVTGRSDAQTGSASNLVDINIIDSDSGDGRKVGKPQTGGIIRQVMDGNNYEVEFFDEDLNLANRVKFQGMSSRVADFDLAPDVGVSDIFVVTNRKVDGIENACFLYRGEQVSALDVTVQLKYTDGRVRDVSYELVEGGRLSIEGMDDLSTDVVTPPGVTPTQKIKVTYQMLRTNASLPDNAQNTPSGGLLDPATLSISKEVLVYVKEDVYADIVQLIVAAWTSEPVPTQTKVNLKYFALYSSGAIHDVTNIIQYTGTPPTLNDAALGVVQNLNVRVPYGNAGYFKSFGFSLQALLNGEGRCLIDGEDTRVISYDPSSNAGGTKSGRFTAFKILRTVGGEQVVSLASLLTQMALTVQGGVELVPNYVRVRDVEKSEYLFTGPISDANSLYYTEVSSGQIVLRKYRPLLVEFLHLTIENNVAVTSFVTGGLIHYALSV